MLADEQAMNQTMFELMSRSDNDVVREMGRELLAGNVTLQGLGEVPAYREALLGGLDQVAALDLGAMSEQFDEAIAEQEETAGEAPEDEEPDDVFQGLWGDQQQR